MDALCAPGRARPWQQGRTQVSVLVLIVIILIVTAIEGWALAEVATVITAAAAASATVGDRRAAG
jgi:hypothetical protein